jgi:hypothetical protein
MSNMTNMNPFQLRLELLKMAKDMLEQDYFAQREKVSNEYAAKCDSAKINGQPIPEHPGFTPFPSETEIIKKATELNSFVSQIPQDIPKTGKKST